MSVNGITLSKLKGCLQKSFRFATVHIFCSLFLNVLPFKYISHMAAVLSDRCNILSKQLALTMAYVCKSNQRTLGDKKNLKNNSNKIISGR